MSELLRMPEIAAGTETARLAEWLIDEGAAFTATDTVATIETDKAVVDFTPGVDGVLLQKLVATGTDVAVGDPIAVVGVPAEVSAAPNAAPEAAPPKAVPPKAARIFTSPLARRLANEARIDPAGLNGSGPNGRIVRADVEAAIRIQQPETRPETRPKTQTEPDPEPAARTRRAIAARLTESKQTVPHFYVRGSAVVDDLLALRQRVNAGGGTKVSLNDFVLKAVAKAHRLVPAMNVIWSNDRIQPFESVDVGVAIAAPNGLVSPVLRGVDGMSITALATTTRDFGERARAGRLYQHELEGGATTVTNLGMYGLEEFSAIINPPQSSILAVGAVRREPVVTPEGTVEPRSVVHVVLSVDHRPVDGVVAAGWMRAFLGLLADPIRILT